MDLNTKLESTYIYEVVDLFVICSAAPVLLLSIKTASIGT